MIECGSCRVVKKHNQFRKTERKVNGRCNGCFGVHVHKSNKMRTGMCRNCPNKRSPSKNGLCNLCFILSGNARTYTSPTYICTSAYCQKCQKTKMKEEFDKDKDGVERSWCKECVEANRPKTKTLPDTMPGNTYHERNINLLSIGYKTYAEYLCSDLWVTIRGRAYKSKGTCCALCKSPATEMHHNRYSVEDLTGVTIKHLHPLCHVCHEGIEFKGEVKRDLLSVRQEFNRRFGRVNNQTKKKKKPKWKRRRR